MTNLISVPFLPYSFNFYYILLTTSQLPFLVFNADIYILKVPLKFLFLLICSFSELWLETLFPTLVIHNYISYYPLCVSVYTFNLKYSKILFVWGLTFNGAQDFFLALYSKITPGETRRAIWDARNRIFVGTCKANTLLTILLF